MSKTKENLEAAFAGESMARNKYTFFAKVARKEGYHYVAKIFEETAINEMRHANDHLKLLGGIGDTIANLQDAMEGEDYETTTMYQDFAAVAKEEGNLEAAAKFEMIGKVEADHRERYKKLLARVKAGTVYTRDEPITWKCSLCGYLHEGTEPPEKCPACAHPKEYYEPADLDTDI